MSCLHSTLELTYGFEFFVVIRRKRMQCTCANQLSLSTIVDDTVRLQSD